MKRTKFQHFSLPIFLILLSSTVGNKSLVTIKNRSSRSVEATCNDNNLKACLDADVDPSLPLNKEDISINGIDLQFQSTVEPNGFVYKNKHGDEAIITVNPRTGNMFGSLKTHDERSYAIEKGLRGYVWKDFDTRSFMLEIPVKTNKTKDLSKKKLLEKGAKDTTTVVTYSAMIYYTPDFASVTPDIEGFVDQVLAEVNQGYINSLIPVRITKLCIEQATINDNDIQDLGTFRRMKGTDSALRNTADSAFLLTVRLPGYCGVAYLSTFDKYVDYLVVQSLWLFTF